MVPDWNRFYLSQQYIYVCEIVDGAALDFFVTLLIFPILSSFANQKVMDLQLQTYNLYQNVQVFGSKSIYFRSLLSFVLGISSLDLLWRLLLTCSGIWPLQRWIFARSCQLSCFYFWVCWLSSFRSCCEGNLKLLQLQYYPRYLYSGW